MSSRSALLLLFAVCLSFSLFAQSPQGDPKQRAKAAKELGKQGTSAIPALQRYLSDPDVDVRVEAVKALVGIGTQYSLNPLIQATHDNDPEVQIRAAEGLVNFYYPGYVKSGWSASFKRASTHIMTRFTDTNDQVIDPYIQVRPEVIAALGSLARGGSSMDSRAAAARAVGVLRGRAAIPDLLAALRSKDDQVMYESLVALQKIRDESVGPKITFLLHDLDDQVQITALETVGLLRTREALPDIRDAVKHARNTKVRRAALSALAMIPDPQNREFFVRYFDDKDEGLRAASAEGFGRLANPSDREMLDKAFNHERKMSPRLSLAFALVCLGENQMSDFGPLTYLVNTLNSKSYRGIAQPFLVELLRKQVNRAAIYSRLTSGTTDEKIGLAQILAASGGKDSLAPLDALSRDPDAEVAQEALRASQTLKARLP